MNQNEIDDFMESLAYDEYVNTVQKAADLGSASALLDWDQNVHMPPKSEPYRSRQLATLASQSFEMLTSPTYGRNLRKLLNAKSLTEDQMSNIRLSWEDYNDAIKFTSEFVEELSVIKSEGFNAWSAAKKQKDFSLFAPALKKMIDIKRREAKIIGYDEHPYDALLDEYEKGMTVKVLDPFFESVRALLLPMLEKIKDADQIDNSFMSRSFSKEKQFDFGLEVLKIMNFDLDAGRQDYSEHPFCTAFSSTDVRITTRYVKDDFQSMLWSSLHEGGHGLYEQGLPEGQYGLPLGTATSLGIHESQSRLWENCVGRSIAFWIYLFWPLKEKFPEELSEVTVLDFYKGINKVEPSLIRIDGDELTYHLHIMIRYEIEKRLIEGSLEVEDLPAYWNEMYEKYLGIRPNDDSDGVMQDVHWSCGLFGYFPTYTLGSFYAAQFYACAKREIPDLELEIANGQTSSLLNWLREKIHFHGRKYTSEELCKKVTGEGLNPEVFFEYAKNKFGYIYNYDNKPINVGQLNHNLQTLIKYSSKEPVNDDPKFIFE